MVETRAQRGPPVAIDEGGSDADAAAKPAVDAEPVERAADGDPVVGLEPAAEPPAIAGPLIEPAGLDSALLPMAGLDQPPHSRERDTGYTASFPNTKAVKRRGKKDLNARSSTFSPPA